MSHDKIEQVLIGIPASPGICHGPAVLFSEGHLNLPCYSISPENIKNEERRLDSAVVATRKEILEIRKKVSSTFET